MLKDKEKSKMFDIQQLMLEIQQLGICIPYEIKQPKPKSK